MRLSWPCPSPKAGTRFGVAREMVYSSERGAGDSVPLFPFMRFLVIEDDADTRDFIVQGLNETGHPTDSAANGREGLLLALEREYDAIVLDRMLPGLDGLSIVKTLRAEGKKTPILILSALGEVSDRVEGLTRG